MTCAGRLLQSASGRNGQYLFSQLLTGLVAPGGVVMTKETESTKQAALDLTVYPADQQGTGSFDNGRITEIKPIGFPGDKSAVSRVGPLFYWAWASSHGEAEIALHPHRGFEILSYVLAGELGHYDTLGTRSRVKTGGAQVMQTGSGISHEEKTFGPGGEFFQIWFEPNLRLALS